VAEPRQQCQIRIRWQQRSIKAKMMAEANRVLSEREWLATEISDMISARLTEENRSLLP
jgi:hypothetical protein